MSKTLMKTVSVRRKALQRGAAMVEGSFVLLTLISSILFTMDMGRMLLFQQFYTERARVAARSAVVNNWTTDQTANYVCYGSTSAPGVTTQDEAEISSGTQGGLLGCVPSDVTVTVLGTAGVDQRIRVKVSGVPMFSWVPFMSGNYQAAPVVVTMPAESLGATN